MTAARSVRSRQSPRKSARKSAEKPQLRAVPASVDGVPVRDVAVGVAAALLVGALFGLAIFHTMLNQGQAALEGIEMEREVEAERNRELRAAIAELEAPERVTAAAEDRLGMTRPANITWLDPVDPLFELDAAEVDAAISGSSGADVTGAEAATSVGVPE